MYFKGRGYSEIKDSLPKSIEVACHNSSTSCTISGPAEDVEIYVKQLEHQGIFAKTVNVSNIAYHSRYIAPAAPKLQELLEPVCLNIRIWRILKFFRNKIFFIYICRSLPILKNDPPNGSALQFLKKTGIHL